MTANAQKINFSPFLPTTRNIPMEMQPLAIELNRMYPDIANCVNSRIIGIYPTNDSIPTGESFYFTTQRQQILRQLFAITSTTTFNHNLINFDPSTMLPYVYGVGTDGTNAYPLPYVSPTAAQSIGVYVSSTQVVFNVGGSAPTITSGYIVLEWLSNP